jgi:hypothetical protein
MEQYSPPFKAVGRESRCCSMDCVDEMSHRSILSSLNQPYEPRKRKEEKKDTK